MKNNCACGCGMSVDGRSRYRQDHLPILVAARRRWREARRNAWRRGYDFDLTLEDVHRLVIQVWPRDEGLALARIDRSRGFVNGNVALTQMRGGRTRRTSNVKLARQFERLARRADVDGRLEVDDIAHVYAAQKACCALSGCFLRPAARLGDPDAMVMIRLDPRRPFCTGNVALVTACVASVVERWGIDRLETMAKGVVKASKPKATEKPDKPDKNPTAT